MMSMWNLVSAKSGVNELDLRINDLGASESTTTEVFLRGSTRMFNQSISVADCMQWDPGWKDDQVGIGQITNENNQNLWVGFARVAKELCHDRTPYQIPESSRRLRGRPGETAVGLYPRPFTSKSAAAVGFIIGFDHGW
jgi:hypothetical protein